MTLNNEYLELEGTDIKLIWRAPIEQLHSKFGKGKEERGDRTIYYWVNKTILNGLTLNLTSRFWNFQEHVSERTLTRLEFWAIGDEVATEWFDRVSDHLKTNFGEPTEMNHEHQPDKIWTWQLGDLTLTLNFFEQHSQKLCFSIKKSQ